MSALIENSTLIKNGWLIDPCSNQEGCGHIWLADGRIQKVAFGMSAEEFVLEAGLLEADDVTVIDAGGKWVIPGLVDLHVHFRDPGLTHKEDIQSGCRAAARGGVTTVCCMPNTKPVIDDGQTVAYVLQAAAKACGVRVLPVGAITEGQEGRVLSDIDAMLAADSRDTREQAGAAIADRSTSAIDDRSTSVIDDRSAEAVADTGAASPGASSAMKHCAGGGQVRGICALSEDGKSVMDEALMFAAMKKAAACGLPVFSHTEDYSLSGGAMHECELSRRMGIKGIPPEAEENIVERDIRLAAAAGCRLHLCHISTAGSVALIRAAREKGIAVTAEAAPHHFTLTADDLLLPDGSLDTNKKMAPPLRTKEDVQALRQAIREGVISAIATDHAPHQDDEKNTAFEKAPFGSTGLETSFAISYTELIKTGLLTPLALIDRMCRTPADILGLPAGTLREGSRADIAIIDINESWTVKREDTVSKSKNTPFDGKRVWGKVCLTIANGRVIYNQNGR